MASPFVIKCENCEENLTENPDRKRCSNCKLVYYCDAQIVRRIMLDIKVFVRKNKFIKKTKILFILGHSGLIEEVFKDNVKILNFKKLG